MRLVAELSPNPLGEHTALPDPLAGFRGRDHKEGKWEERHEQKWRGREGK